MKAKTLAKPVRNLYLVVLLLLLYIAVRSFHLLALPPFIDESIHIKWAQQVYEGHFLIGANDGRLLALWWMSLFDLRGDAKLMIVRLATLLLCTLNVALVYSLGKSLGNRLCGLLASALYIISPYAAFYERIGMTDTYVALFALAAIWFGYRYLRKLSTIDGLLSGAALTAAILAKGQGMMLVVVPLFAVLLLNPKWNAKVILRSLAIIYGAFVLTWGPCYLFLSARGWSYFGTSTSTVGTAQLVGLPERLAKNLGQLWAIDSAYFSTTLLVVACISAVYLIYRRWRVGLFVVLATAMPVSLLSAFATEMRPRYFEFHVPLLILTIGIGFGGLLDELYRRRGTLWPVTALISSTVPLLWCLFFGLPFMNSLYTAPETAPLAANDRLEYIMADSSGFALDKVASFLLDRSKTGQPVRAIGLISNCGGLSTEVPEGSGVTVECPLINFDGSEQTHLAELVNRRSVEADDFDLWVVIETIPYVSMNGVTATYTPVASFDRPGNISKITLIHILRTVQSS